MRSLRWVAALTLMTGLAAGCGTATTPGASRTPAPPGAAPSATAPRSARPPAPSPPARTAAPSPATTRTSLPGQPGHLVAISVGRHAAFDRMVFRFSGPVPGYRAGYVKAVRSDPKGQLVPLPGQAFVRVVFHPATGYSGPQAVTPLFPALLQIQAAGDFEGYLSFGAGVSQRAALHVFTLTQPNRLVIDIPHTAMPPFPGIWDITSWPQFWSMQIAVMQGHQPWLLSPPMVVQAWAAGNMTNPVVQQTGPGTFTVTEPSTGKQATITGTCPVTAGARIWVITKIADNG